MSEIKHKVYSVEWQVPVNPLGATWQSFFQINSPQRRMDLLGIYFNIMYRDAGNEQVFTEENIDTQRIQFGVVPAVISSNIMELTGGTPFQGEGNLIFFRSCNIKFNSFYFENLIPMVIQGWNNDPANVYYHLITLIIEVNEL